MIYNKYKYNVPKEKMVRVIVDTDAKNEADDQFTVVQALLTPKFDNVGVIAAHFGKTDSMNKSYEEVEKIFSLMKFNTDNMIFHGAQEALSDNKTPICSEGAQKIIDEALKDDDRPLFVLLLGPLTDLASAYLMEPRIAGKLTAIWIGGGKYPNGSVEYNLGNDIIAANVVFSSKIDLWQVPKNVYEMMPVSFAELELKVEPCGEIGRYLFDQLNDHAHESDPRKSIFRTGETWVFGDSPAVGLLLYEHRYEFEWVQAPLITKDMTYVHTGLNRPIRVYKSIDSRLILEDFFAKLKLFSINNQNG